MLRVIIVDDERTIRLALRTMIGWEQNGFELAGTASDGLQALQLIDDCPADIVITDLKMPNMNGLELLHALKERDYSGKVIVLSNHGDYELVREAMKIGAVDYLLKVTLKPDDLLQVLEKTAEQLARERKDKEHRLRIQHELIETQLEKRNAAWKELLEEEDEQLPDAQRDAEKNAIALERLEGHLFFVCIDQYKQALAGGKIKNKKLLHFSVMNIIKEIISGNDDIDLIDLGDGQYAAVLYDTPWTEGDAASTQLASNIVKLIRTYLNLDVSVTISGRFGGLGQLREQYRYCRRAAAAKFYHGAGSVLLASATAFDEKLTSSRFPDWSAAVKAAFEEENDEALSAQLGIMMDEMVAVRCDPELVKNVFLILLTDLEHIVAKWKRQNDRPGGDTESGQSIIAIKQRIMHAESVRHLQADAESALLHVASQLRETKRQSFRKEVLHVIGILHDRMEEKISLDMLATSVNLNESYLCRIFKQDTGKSIFQYMNELKINHAVELLKGRDARVKEVAVSVGIEDPFYFNRLFKKVVGVSPSEYRKKILAGHHS
ncbi:response regulator [Paenibacillus sp. LHD-117]|uniref:response regulator transcription factor n=1 Tax=Paenibacillus sp. LHD-117 TaxID=3071412 RepID=UPI0027E1817E|nr:response regulator [Paenibacillus sp. LHD-117]MDQ6418906.1 response regulator [Paenibacillus sp. LHD-117]